MDESEHSQKDQELVWAKEEIETLGSPTREASTYMAGLAVKQLKQTDPPVFYLFSALPARGLHSITVTAESIIPYLQL